MHQTYLPHERELLTATMAALEGQKVHQVLSRVMLAMVMRHLPEPETKLCLDMAVQHGAMLLTSTGITDLGKHRCLMASKILRNLHVCELDTVVLIDSDQVVSLVALSTVVALSRALHRPVSGAYVVRNSPSPNPPLACVPIRAPEIDYTIDTIDTTPCLLETVYLPQIYGGLGCMAIPADLFRQHADRSHWIVEKRSGYTITFPAVCWTGPIKDAEQEWAWVPEDFCYCELFSEATGVLPVLAPISIGHVRIDDDGRREVLWPSPSSTFVSDPPELPWGPDGKVAPAPPPTIPEPYAAIRD